MGFVAGWVEMPDATQGYLSSATSLTGQTHFCGRDVVAEFFGWDGLEERGKGFWNVQVVDVAETAVSIYSPCYQKVAPHFPNFCQGSQ